MASLIPNGEQTFLDLNGKPLAGGQVFFYTPGTTTPATTYTDQTLSVANPNPITLDQAGRCVAWGDGYFRQVVHDMFGNLIWDRTTGLEISHIFGGLQVDGILNVNGAAGFQNDVSVAGNLGTSGSLFVDGSGQFGGTLGATGQITGGAFHSLGNVQVDNDLHVNGVANMDTIHGQANNQIEILNSISVNETAGLSFAINVIGDEGSVTHIDGKTNQIVSGDNPCFAMSNTSANLTMGSWTNTVLNWGICTGAGRPATELMNLDDAGNLTVVGTITSSGGGGGPVTFPNPVTFAAAGNCAIFNGDIVPATAHGSNVGNAGSPWGGVWASNFITASTDAAAPRMVDGALELVMETPVKMEPHVGIAAWDAGKMPGAVAEGNGTDMHALLGYLWKALQELKGEFDAYKAAHP